MLMMIVSLSGMMGDDVEVMEGSKHLFYSLQVCINDEDELIKYEVMANRI